MSGNIASRFLVSLLLLPALCALYGCESPAERMGDSAFNDYLRGDFATAEAKLEPLAKTADENFVLNNVRLGSACLADYQLDKAESAFLQAYEVINSVHVNGGARALGAAALSEKIKVWKGEPFERAMANFYLGLVYYMRHDYNNARGAFENALFKLRDYGQDAKSADSYRLAESNFALGYLMLGKSYLRLGRAADAQKALARAVELRGDLAPAADYALNEGSNILLVVDYGNGPVKGTNRDGSLIGFYPSPRQAGPIPRLLVSADGRWLQLNGMARPPTDLLAMAQERQWQNIDTIRAVKSGVGSGLIAGGSIYGAVERDANPLVALGLIAGGLALKASSHADVRQWEMLPRTTFIVPLALPPGTHDISVVFPNVRGMRQEWRGLVVPAEGEATYYLRMLPASPGPFTWPPPGMAAK